MRSSVPALVLAVLLPSLSTAQYREAVPGYRYEFPADHFDHPAFQTEWWYYTGNVNAPDGRSFGFQLTFFRRAVARGHSGTSPWDVHDLYLAHAALSDLRSRRFYHRERLNRAGPGIAGVSRAAGRIWNGNWKAEWEGSRQRLEVITSEFSFRLLLVPEKEPVIHGAGGVSQKAQGPGRASHYISLTRLSATGAIEVGGQTFPTRGTAWMDHEFFTHQLGPDQIGWDWLSLQLDDGTDLMLFRLRRRDGSMDSFSAGTFVSAAGDATPLTVRDFDLRPLDQTWTSPSSGATYPVRWQVSVPSLDLRLEVSTPLPQQEIKSQAAWAPTYWEGAVRAAGSRRGEALAGVGYLEMTGYDRPVSLNP